MGKRQLTRNTTKRRERKNNKTKQRREVVRGLLSCTMQADMFHC